MNPSAGTSQADGPVTAIDVNEGTDFAVCGYFSGRVILWDIMTGAEIKVCTCVRARVHGAWCMVHGASCIVHRYYCCIHALPTDIFEQVADFHRAPVTSVRFCSGGSPTVLSVDTNGCVSVFGFLRLGCSPWLSRVLLLLHMLQTHESAPIHQVFPMGSRIPLFA